MDAIKRIVLRLFPELSHGYHLPMLGRVEAITDAPKDGGRCTLERPRFALDIQPLDEHLQPKGELLRDITMATPYAGQHRGFFALPDPGCIIEFCFSYAMPNLIHVRGVIPWGLELPAVDSGEAKWQHSKECYQGYDKDGNWHQIGKIHQNRAAIKQIMKSPKTWCGSDQENVLKILSDFMQDTAEALDIIASHTHPNVAPCAQSGAISGKSGSIKGHKSGRLDPITE